MAEIIWCFLIVWSLVGVVYVLGLLADMVIDFLIDKFKNNGTE